MVQILTVPILPMKKLRPGDCKWAIVTHLVNGQAMTEPNSLVPKSVLLVITPKWFPVQRERQAGNQEFYK